MNTIEYLVHLFAYEWIFLVALGMPVVILVEIVRWVASEPIQAVLRVVIGGSVIAWVLGSSWLAHEAARRRVFEGAGFLDAVGNAFDEGRSRLAFLSLVLPWIRRRRQQGSRYDEPPRPQ